MSGEAVTVAFISDSHGAQARLDQFLTRLEQLQITPDRIFHLGDFIIDGQYVASESGIHTICVKGNCDMWTAGRDYAIETIHGRIIFAVHGDQYNVKREQDALISAALYRDASLCAFGHTHQRAFFQEGECLFLNPGSLNQSRGEEPSFAIVTIQPDGAIEVVFYPLFPPDTP